VILSHAHIDHSGYLPALVRDGFDGPIWTTPGTAALCGILLPDAAHLQEEDARHANRRRSSKHHPALPLFTAADAQAALDLLRTHPVDHPFAAADGVDARFTGAGHILVAACVHLAADGASVTFTGDVGRPHDPVMLPPAPPPAADHLVTESTYGNRQHPDTDPLDELETVVNATLRRGGTLLIPSFAVGRAQTLLYLLSRLRGEGRIPEVPVYLNSPMAVDATELFWAHRDEHRLTDEECAAMSRDVHLVRTVEESKRLTPLDGPMIVLSASGMMSGGRVLHHLLQLAPNPRNTILLTGYQAAGTRGEALLAGTRRLKVFGEYVTVRARVEHLDTLSAHADADELTTWLSGIDRPPSRVHIVHGEPSATDALRRSLHDDLGWATSVPSYGSSVEVEPLA